MKKLLYLSNSIIPSSYANSVHVMKMCQALSYSFEVELLCYTLEKEFDIENVFENYGVKSKFQISSFYLKNVRGKFFQKIFSILKKLNSYNKNETLIYGRDVYSVYLASLLGFKVIYESHGLPTTKLYSNIEKKLLNSNNLKKLIVISNKLKEFYLESDFQLKGNIIEVLHDGADELNLEQDKIDLGIGFHIGYIGSLYYEGRGVDIILEIAKENLDKKFHLIGGKKDEIAYWKEKASENVNFYGFLPHTDASKYLLSFDVVLMPYKKDLKLADSKVNTSSWMSPMKMFEYMSAKKAIISSDLPVIREVLNKNNSILVNCDNVNEWSLAINKLYNDRIFAKDIALNSFNDFNKYYTWKKRAFIIKKFSIS